MSFGFGVGDLIVVLGLCGKLRKRFVDAPVHFTGIAAEVKTLSHLIADIEDVLSVRQLDAAQFQRISTCLDGCNEVLKDLDVSVNKYSDVSDASDGLRARARGTWKRMIFEPQDIRDLRSRLTSNITLLSSFLESLTISDLTSVKNELQHLIVSGKSQRQQSVLAWLSDGQHASQHADLVQRLQPGSGRWFLTSSAFQDWLSTSRSTLFCHGIPGAGKTLMACLSIEHIRNSLHSPLVCFAYCNFRKGLEYSSINLLTNFTEQLARAMPDVPLCLENLYARHEGSRSRPSASDLIEALCEMIRAASSSVYIIVDALDECTSSERNRMLDDLFELQSIGDVRLMATSRPILEVDNRFRSMPRIEIKANSHDVRQFLSTQIGELPAAVRRNQQLQKDICAAIEGSIDGMFLLAKLHVESLRHLRKPREIRDTLRALQQRSHLYSLGALDAAYDKAIHTMSKNPADMILAKQIIAWIMSAERPLTVCELQHALAVEDDPQYGIEDLVEEEDLLSVCAGLVEIDSKRGVVRFVHYTTQEYFEKIRATWLPDAARNIAKACIACLSRDDLANGICRNAPEMRRRLQVSPLGEYCAFAWPVHVRCAGLVNVREELLGFLNHRGKVSAAHQLLCIHKRRFQYFRNAPTRTTGLNLAACLGDVGVVHMLLEEDFGADITDSHGRSPLANAARDGQVQVVETLLARADVAVNRKDKRNYTPLALATFGGHEAVVRSLLKHSKVEINVTGSQEAAAIIVAAASQDEDTFRALLERDDLDVNVQNENDGSALHLAAAQGDVANVEAILLRNDVDVNSQDSMGRTPLFRAAARGLCSIVGLLLHHPNIDINMTNDRQATPLCVAAERGGTECVALLLNHPDVQVNLTDAHGRTPLMWSLLVGAKLAAELLVTRHDVEIDVADCFGGTALVYALARKVDSVAEILAKGKTDVDMERARNQARAADLLGAALLE